MKLSTVIPPLIALAAAPLWLVARQKQIREVEHDIRMLEARIELAAAGEAAPSQVEPRERPPESTEVWKRFEAAWFRAQLSENPNEREKVRMQMALMQMNEDELRAALEEFDAMDIEKRLKESMRYEIEQHLYWAAPKPLLEHKLDSTPGDRIIPPYSFVFRVFQNWVQDHPAEASSWLNAQVAAGSAQATRLQEQFQSKLADPVGSEPAQAREPNEPE